MFREKVMSIGTRRKVGLVSLIIGLVALLALIHIRSNQEIESSDSIKMGSIDSINPIRKELGTLISPEEAGSIALNTLQMTETGIELSHPNHHVTFESDGVLFEPRKGPNWKWQLTHIGTEEEPLKGLSTQPVQPENNDPRIVSYRYGNIVEEYHAKQNTVEQRFVLAEPLSLGSQDLVIKGRVESQGEFEKKEKGSQKSWTWSDPSGQVELGDVTVFDAEGQILMACMNVTAESTEIIVDAQSLATATYPVTVDPEIGANDLRISDMGLDGSTGFAAMDSAVAYNSTDNEYLVVWQGNDLPLDSELEIYGQRIDACTGAEVGVNDFQISDMGPNGDTSFGAFNPAVAYNSANNEYFVVWHGRDIPLVLGDVEIFGQRLTAAGTEVGGNDILISGTGPSTSPNFNARDPAITYNSTGNEYVVVWSADGLGTDNEFEIFGQRVDGATGVEVGTDDFRISDMGPDGDASFEARIPAVAYNSTNNEYLIVWRGDDDTHPLVDGEYEIFGQRIDATSGVEVGANDFRISNVGAHGSGSLFSALDPAVAYNPIDNEYLVVWSADGLGTNNELEIFGQRVDGATGVEVGTDDFRISDMGPDGNINFDAASPDVTHNSSSNEYLVVWNADDDTPPLEDGEFEIFCQRLDGTTGAEIGENDFRISDMGPKGDKNFYAAGPAVVHNSIDNEFFTVWWGDDDSFPLVDDEFEIFCQRFNLNGLLADIKELSLFAGGTQCMTMDFGSDCAGFFYLVLGTTIGTSPGTYIDGQKIPLNPDAYFVLALNNPNSSLLSMSFGTLDAKGQGTAKFTVPPGSDPSLAGTVVHHAALVIHPSIILGIIKVSKAVSALLVP